MSMLNFEPKYRVEGETLVGGRLFDFWVGPFYVGFFGVTAAFFAILGTLLIFYGAAIGPTWQPFKISIDPPDISRGLGFAPLKEGGLWQLITICALGGVHVRGLCARSRSARKLGIGLPCADRVQFGGDLRVLRRWWCSGPMHAGRLGLWVPVWDHEPSGLGFERRVSVSTLSLQPRAHAGGDVLLHDDVHAFAAWWGDIGGGESLVMDRA